MKSYVTYRQHTCWNRLLSILWRFCIKPKNTVKVTKSDRNTLINIQYNLRIYNGMPTQRLYPTNDSCTTGYCQFTIKTPRVLTSSFSLSLLSTLVHCYLLSTLLYFLSSSTRRTLHESRNYQNKLFSGRFVRNKVWPV